MINSGPSAREVISLQKVDSLLVFEYTCQLKRLLQDGNVGIWIKIHLNLKTTLGLVMKCVAHGWECKKGNPSIFGASLKCIYVLD
jgi:hypothetical protein